MYKSPIDLFVTDIMTQIEKQADDEICKAVASIGINVDKDELIRALQYDWRQYERGYADGKADAMAGVVRCKDCKHWAAYFDCCEKKDITMHDYDFCSYGERREGE